MMSTVYGRPDQVRLVLDAAATGAPVRFGFCAPGGHGKTALLGELERALGAAGVDVLPVDDAHALDDETLRDLARRPEANLIVAYRPWPRSQALTDLVATLRYPPVTLPVLDRAEIEEYLHRAGLAAPEPALVDFVSGQTGGVPLFVARLVGSLPPGTSTSDRQLPAAAVTAFADDLDRIPPDVRMFLLAAEAGLGLRTDLVGELLSRDADGVARVMAAARASGLVGPDGTPPPIVRQAIASLTPPELRTGARQRLAELERARGGRVLPLARTLLGTGIGGPSVATTFETAAEEALPDQPDLSMRLFHAAAGAGRPVPALAARWARAAALAGDLTAALRLADQAISAPDSRDQAEGAQVAAAALAHRGQLARSAELYRWAGPGPSAAFARVALIGAGHPPAEVPASAASPTDGPPTLLAGAAALIAQGVEESVTGSPTAALSTLVRAADLLEPAGRTVLLPDSPAALATLVALHDGDLGTAGSVLDRARASGQGGSLLAIRHQLLRAWVLMVRGDLAGARDKLGATAQSGRMESRDWLTATALEVGLARRNSDLVGLRRAWGAVGEAVIRHPVDLFTLLPLGEFAIAAARLRDHDRLADHLTQAHELLRRLGDPPLWAAPLHWSGLHACVIAERTAQAEEHVAALTAMAHHGPYRAALANAARCWLDVIAGRVRPATVEAAARGLHDVGMSWDATRLAGQAAVRTSDRKAMVALLECARLLQGRAATRREPAATPAPPAVPERDTDRLSDRERDVADLVVAGLTYRQIGDRLFISAKTVEHHVARMRQRLGCTSRGDLLARLRELVGPTG